MTAHLEAPPSAFHLLRSGYHPFLTSALGLVPKPDQAVVFVYQLPGTFHGEQFKMDQRGKLFVPYVLPIVQGTSVEFHNSDNLQHNVFGVGGDKFNRRSAQRRKRSHLPRQARTSAKRFPFLA